MPVRHSRLPRALIFVFPVQPPIRIHLLTENGHSSTTHGAADDTDQFFIDLMPITVHRIRRADMRIKISQKRQTGFCASWRPLAWTPERRPNVCRLVWRASMQQHRSSPLTPWRGFSALRPRTKRMMKNHSPRHRRHRKRLNESLLQVFERPILLACLWRCRYRCHFR